jgi:membrane protease YdiL (CAAX protease family)
VGPAPAGPTCLGASAVRQQGETGRLHGVGMHTRLDSTAAQPATRARPAAPRRGRRLPDDVLAFTGIVAAGATTVALALPGTEEAPGPVALLTLLVPAFAAGAMRLIFRRRTTTPLPATGIRRMGWRFWPLAAVLAASAIATSYALAWAVGVADFDGLGAYAASAPLQIAFLCVLLLGEELGWRGYLFPRLEPVVGPRRAAVATGIAHGAFHIPLLTLTSAYDSDGSRWIVVPGVVAVVTLGGVVFGWLRHRSGSLWPVLIAHATVNVCLITDPELVTSRPGLTAAVTGEGGVLTVATVGTVAWLVHRYGDWRAAASDAR